MWVGNLCASLDEWASSRGRKWGEKDRIQDRECVWCVRLERHVFWLSEHLCGGPSAFVWHLGVFARCCVLSSPPSYCLFLRGLRCFPARLTDNTPKHPLKALLALIAISLRSNMPVLIVLKCNQSLHSRGANNLNLTKHLRRPSARPW